MVTHREGSMSAESLIYRVWKMKSTKWPNPVFQQGIHTLKKKSLTQEFHRIRKFFYAVLHFCKYTKGWNAKIS